MDLYKYANNNGQKFAKVMFTFKTVLMIIGTFLFIDTTCLCLTADLTPDRLHLILNISLKAMSLHLNGTVAN